MLFNFVKNEKIFLVSRRSYTFSLPLTLKEHNVFKKISSRLTNHQFGFRKKKHSTIEQVPRIVTNTRSAFESKI